jgi:hypothetical protein
VRSVGDVRVDESVRVAVSDGSFAATVNEKNGASS